MKHKRLIIWMTIALILIAVSAAFAYGKANVGKVGDGKAYFESLNEFDWSKACPAAGCRNSNEEE